MSLLDLHGNLRLFTTHITLSYYRVHYWNTDEQERCTGCSISVIRLRGERQRNSWFSGGASDFLPLRNVETGSGLIQPCIQWLLGGGRSQRVKRPGRERGRLPRLVPGLRLIVSIPPLLLMSLLRCQVQSNYTFTEYWPNANLLHWRYC